MALVWIPATLVSGQTDLGRSKGDPRCWTEPLWQRFREHCCQDESSWDRMRCGMPDFSYITFAKCCQGKGFYNSADNCLHSQSQHGEENFIIDTFQWQKKRDGVYVEMGAFDGITYSNTLRLHSCFGWRGILIEGSPRNFARLQLNWPAARPINAVAYNGAVCAPPRNHVTFITNQDGAMDADVEHMTREVKNHYNDTFFGEVERIPCKPMSSYLRGTNHIDFFALDVEGSELEVLLTMDFTEVTVEVFMIEFHWFDPEKSWKIRNLLKSLGYLECRKSLDINYLFVRKDGPYAGRC
ncbi:PRX [Symbiodinium sp. CCMP2592]|nr:PRX [Symbiodinium sp. CCMP2592]